MPHCAIPAPALRRALLLGGVVAASACASVEPIIPETWGADKVELSINPNDAFIRKACNTGRVPRPRPDSNGAFDVEGVVVAASGGGVGVPYRAKGIMRADYVILETSLNFGGRWTTGTRDSLVPGHGDFSAGASCIL